MRSGRLVGRAVAACLLLGGALWLLAGPAGAEEAAPDPVVTSDPVVTENGVAISGPAYGRNVAVFRTEPHPPPVEEPPAAEVVSEDPAPPVVQIMVDQRRREPVAERVHGTLDAQAEASVTPPAGTTSWVRGPDLTIVAPSVARAVYLLRAVAGERDLDYGFSILRDDASPVTGTGRGNADDVADAMHEAVHVLSLGARRGEQHRTSGIVSKIAQDERVHLKTPVSGFAAALLRFAEPGPRLLPSSSRTLEVPDADPLIALQG